MGAVALEVTMQAAFALSRLGVKRHGQTFCQKV
jgi:hypothetical protein